MARDAPLDALCSTPVISIIRRLSGLTDAQLEQAQRYRRRRRLLRSPDSGIARIGVLDPGRLERHLVARAPELQPGRPRVQRLRRRRQHRESNGSRGRVVRGRRVPARRRDGVSLPGARADRRRVPVPQPRAAERGPVLWRGAGFLLTIATSSGLATLHFDPRDMRETAGGVLGQLVGRGLEHGLGLLGATVLLLVLWLAAVSLATGVSWVAVMDRVGRAVYAGVVELNVRANQFRIWLEGTAREAAAPRGRGQGAREAEDRGAADRADDREGRGQRARRARARARSPGAAVRAACVDRAARALAAGRPAAEDRRLLRRGARSDVAARRDQAQRLRRRGRSGRGASGARRHALRAQAGGRREEQPDQQPREGSRALARDRERASRRDHSGQAIRRPRDPERGPRARGARRDREVAGLRRAEVAVDARARQGHRRPADVRRPRADAAPPDRGHHGLGQNPSR